MGHPKGIRYFSQVHCENRPHFVSTNYFVLIHSQDGMASVLHVHQEVEFDSDDGVKWVPT